MIILFLSIYFYLCKNKKKKQLSGKSFDHSVSLKSWILVGDKLFDS